MLLLRKKLPKVLYLKAFSSSRIRHSFLSLSVDEFLLAALFLLVPLLLLRFGHGFVRLRKGMVVDYFDLFADQSFNVPDVGIFFGFAEGNGDAFFSGPARPANPVHVGFGYIRDFVIDDVAQLVNVDASCGDISGHQHPHLPCLELLQCFLALILRFVPVDGSGIGPGSF